MESEDDVIRFIMIGGEVEFEMLQRNGIGPESKTQGIVGPVDLTTPHSEIAARLRTAAARQLLNPSPTNVPLFGLSIALIVN